MSRAPESRGDKQFKIEIPLALVERIRAYAKKRRTPMKVIATEAFTYYLRGKEKAL